MGNECEDPKIESFGVREDDIHSCFDIHHHHFFSLFVGSVHYHRNPSRSDHVCDLGMILALARHVHRMTLLITEQSIDLSKSNANDL